MGKELDAELAWSVESSFDNAWHELSKELDDESLEKEYQKLSEKIWKKLTEKHGSPK